MPYASNKTPEQLALEAKVKAKYLVDKAIKCLNQVAGKRSTHPDVKKELKRLVAEELEPLSKAVGPTP